MLLLKFVMYGDFCFNLDYCICVHLSILFCGSEYTTKNVLLLVVNFFCSILVYGLKCPE